MSEDRSPDADFYKNISPNEAKRPRASVSKPLSWEQLTIKQDQLARISSLNAFWSDTLYQSPDPTITSQAQQILDSLSTSWWAKESAFLVFVNTEALPKGLEKLEASIKKIDPSLGNSELVALTLAVHAHAAHLSDTAKVEDVVHGAGMGGLARVRTGWVPEQCIAIANGALFSSAEVVFGEREEREVHRIIAVTPIQKVPQASFIKGMLMGKLIWGMTADGSFGMGLDPLVNRFGERFIASLNQASKRARNAPKSAQGSVARPIKQGADPRYSFLPQEETFICDGLDCGMRARVSDALERRRKALSDSFHAADLADECGHIEGIPDVDAFEHQWYSVILAAASEQEDRGAPGPVLAAHAQDVLSVSGAKAKLLVRAARDRGLLELPRDTIKRFSSPGSFQQAQDIPFPMEGFARLCAECYEAFSSS